MFGTEVYSVTGNNELVARWSWSLEPMGYFSRAQTLRKEKVEEGLIIKPWASC